MRRGLMGRDERELPVAVLQARLSRLRQAISGAGLDGFVLYTNNTRPSAVTWATGFEAVSSAGDFVSSRQSRARVGRIS